VKRGICYQNVCPSVVVVVSHAETVQDVEICLHRTVERCILFLEANFRNPEFIGSVMSVLHSVYYNISVSVSLWARKERHGPQEKCYGISRCLESGHRVYRVIVVISHSWRCSTGV